jgi:hypothetical protein
MSSSTLTARAAGFTTKQKVGLALCGFYALTNIPSWLFTPPDDGETGPPVAILVVDSLLGVIGLVAVILAWRGNRVALRVAAGAIILITLTGLPAFFVDVPMGVKALVGFSVVITVVAVVLMFSGPRRADGLPD